MFSSVENAAKGLKSLVDAGDPSLTKDLRDALGLVTTWERIGGDLEQADVDLIRSIAERIGDLERQVRVLAELGQARAKLTELALSTAAQADSQAAANAEDLARIQWALQENVTATVQKELVGVFGEEYREPPKREHVRRALEATVNAAQDATTPDEEQLLNDVFLGSLTPVGVHNSIGARLRKLVTSGRIGPAEIDLLRKCRGKSEGLLKVDLAKAADLAEIFALASVVPALVTVEISQAGEPPGTGGYISSLDQLRLPAKRLLVRVTDRGVDLLTMLEASKKVRAHLEGER